MQQFMSLLVAQLQNQDPTQPMSDSDFFAQMAQLGNVQGMDNLQQTSQLEEATGMLGKTITATDGTGGIVTGTATQMMMANGAVAISVTDANGNVSQVSLSNIQAVSS
jgi:flagellar basal-body rod modification protein FlgD